MADNKHVVIICSYLNFAGGYERIVVNTANLFAEKGIRTTLLLLSDTPESFYPISKNVEVIQKPYHFGISKKGNPFSRKINMIHDILALKKILKELDADTVVCTEYPFAVGAILCGAKKYSTVVSWEHTQYNSVTKNFFWQQLFNLTYPKLDAIICLNKEEENYFKNFSKTCIIPNFSENKSGNIANFTHKTILSVGSLIPRKGIDLLLETAKLILKKHPDWKWKLIGSGEMKAQVQEFINAEKLHTRFILQDSVSSNLDDEYTNASIFILSSRSETLPMVLIEAQFFGLPCVSFDCTSGPSYIITSGKDGLLVEKENPEKLAAAISSLINDEEKRKMMSKNALLSSHRFSPDAVYKQWVEKIFTL